MPIGIVGLSHLHTLIALPGAQIDQIPRGSTLPSQVIAKALGIQINRGRGLQRLHADHIASSIVAVFKAHYRV